MKAEILPKDFGQVTGERARRLKWWTSFVDEEKVVYTPAWYELWSRAFHEALNMKIYEIKFAHLYDIRTASVLQFSN